MIELIDTTLLRSNLTKLWVFAANYILVLFAEKKTEQENVKWPLFLPPGASGINHFKIHPLVIQMGLSSWMFAGKISLPPTCDVTRTNLYSKPYEP